MLSHRFFLAAALALSAPLSAAHASTYEKDVLPIFKSACFKCHNNDKMKGGVSVEPTDMKSDVGRIIIPGDVRESMLYEALVRDKDSMPPKGSLSQKDLETIRNWIKDGAKFAGDPGAGDSITVSSGLGKKPLDGTWTNKEGRAIKASLLKVEDEKAVLRLPNGKIYNYPLADLAADSAAKAREYATK